MKKEYSRNDEHVKRLASVIRTLTLSQIKEEIRSGNKESCALVMNLDAREIVFSHRLDMVLFLNSPTPAKLKLLPLNFFSRLLVSQYGLAAQELLRMDGYEQLGGATFHFAYPAQLPRQSPLGSVQFVILRQSCEPFILHFEDSGKNALATINYYEIIGNYFPGGHFHIGPIIKKGGLPLIAESKKLIQMAAPAIYVNLPFTKKEWDVLEELSKGRSRAVICKTLNITAHTIEWHFKNIRKKTRNMGLEISPIELAEIFHALQIC